MNYFFANFIMSFMISFVSFIFIMRIITTVIKKRRKRKRDKPIELSVQDYKVLFDYYKQNKKYIKDKFGIISIEDKYTYCDYCGKRTKNGRFHKDCLLEKYNEVIIK